MSPEEMSKDDLVRALRALEEKAREKERENESVVHELRVHQVELELQNRELREAQGALEQSRSRFEELYDFAPVAYYTFDPHGVVQEVNLTGATMVGRDRAKILGMPFLSLVKMTDPSPFWEHLRRCSKTRQPVVSEMRFSTERSGARDLQVVSAPVLDPNGEPVAFRTSFSDITEQKRVEAELARARAEEERLRKHFEALDRVATELTGSLSESTGTAEARALQVIADEARQMADAEYAALGIGSDPERSFAPWVFSGMDPAIAHELGAAPHPVGILGEAARRRSPLRVRDLREDPRRTGLPARHPEMRSFLGVPILAAGRPVGTLYLANKRSAAEFSAEDERLLAMFADRAGRAIEAARLADRERAAVRARDNLLAVVAHDLRSPLQAILTSARLLTRESPAVERRRNARQVDVIVRSTSRMNHLLNDLLEAATIERGSFAIEPGPVAVPGLLGEALQELEPVAAAKSVSLACDAPADLPPLWCDRARTMQVLENLVGNAVKFTPAGGNVVLHAERAGGELRVSVADTGPGIPEEQVPHLFDRYWKGKPEGRHGVGLGLFIAKGIVEAQGGRLWVERAGDGGSTFAFTIPIAREVEADGAAP